MLSNDKILRCRSFCIFFLLVSSEIYRRHGNNYRARSDIYFKDDLTI